ncbi:MAG: DUF3794 domain-containing protein [Oscillospiraceae bacterium]|nr:DUF3794 domain-containing protein [Oscillospiraceae bacterium]
MELKKETVRLCSTIIKGTTQAMAEGDVNVPDIKPDILKILQVDADAYITDKYIENGRLVISGRAEYKVLYVPDKENERIKSILTSMEFRQTVDANGASPDATVIADASVERVEFSAVNSRKLRLRAIIHLDYEVCRTEDHDICTGVEENTAECSMAVMTFENVSDISEHTFTLKETLEVPSGQSSIGEILKTDVKISDTEHKTVTGKIIVKGNVGICILYTDDDNEIKFIEAEVPFTEVLDAENVREDTICDIDYNVVGVMTEAEKDSDGDMRIAAIDIDISASVRGSEPVELETLEDCFIPYSGTECKKETIMLNNIVERPISQNTIREIIDFPSNAPEVGGIYNVMTNSVITKSELQHSRLICEGRIEAYVLYLTNNAENPVYSIKKDIPFSYMIECENAGGEGDIELKAEVKHVSYNLNSSGELELRCLLAIDGKLTEKVEFQNITDIESADREAKHGIVICFAREGDSLWDIAKRYAIPQDKIVKYNSIEENKITKGTKLFIPA